MFDSGKTFGRYKVRSAIGAGGMGEVYLAEDTELERLVALKVLLTEVAQDNDRIRRFVQEAKAASALNHPNILTVYEIGQFEGSRFIATEYIKGKTLRDRLKSEPLTLRETLEITLQIAAALNAAHEAGIVHRDIKPENVMLRDDGLVKILDFGLAKLTEKKNEAFDADSATLMQVKTTPGIVMGTAAYMSPEQARGQEVDARSDIWSLGVVLYEMLARQLPFAGETITDVLADILHREPAPLGENTPSELNRIIGKTLRKNRDERYQTVKDLQIDLKDLRQDLEFEAKLQRSSAPNKNRVNTPGENQQEQTQVLETDKPTDAAVSTKDVITHPTSSAEYVVKEIKQHKRGLLAALSIVILLGVGFGYLFYANRLSFNTKQINSIAVLPFENGSGDANLDYLSDGLSEGLIDKLSQLPQLKVIARSSSFKYRGANIDVQDAANKLGVQAIVMGRVFRVGDNLNVRVEMIDTGENRQLWSELFNRKVADLISVQQEITQAASEKLRLRLSGAQQQQLEKRETVNPQAYESLLKGNLFFNKGGVESRKKANEYYQQAVTIDPNYALAYAQLADSYIYLTYNSFVNPKEFLPKGEAAARKALELDENLPNAHVALANIHVTAWDWAAAETEYKRSLELNPNLAVAHNDYSFYLMLMARHDEAIAEVKRAKELDPLSLNINTSVGYRLYHARRYDEAIEILQKTLELDPNNSFAYIILGYAYNGRKMYREAIAAYQNAIRLGDDTSGVQIFVGASYAQAGERGKAQEILEQLQTGKNYISPGELAHLYATLGDKEATFQSLEKAYAEHDLQLAFLKVSPEFDSLRDDPRFQNLMRRVGLPH